jgi:phosphoribosylanthranilate isomerase
MASTAEVDLAVRYGATAVGLVSAMPSGPGVIAESLIPTLARRVPPGIGTFLLTSLQDADAIVEQQRRCRTNTLQLVDAQPVGTYETLRAALPGVALVQVIHVLGPQSVDEARAVAPYVDGLLLDSGNPSLAIKVLGGTGRVHDWAISAQIRAAVHVPIFLAGGLTPANAAQAIVEVQPYALDICSGVRTNGALDEAKLAAFAKAIAR